MPDLAKTLQDVRKKIARAKKNGLNESATKASLIEPVLRALGWDTENFEEVAYEYRSKSADKPVDYGLLLMRTPRLFVEAKGLGHNLDDSKWARQIMTYATVAGVEWVVLTDGNEYRIYNAHALVHVEEKLFRKVVVDSDDSVIQPTLELLARDRMEENRLQVLWRAEFVDRQVKSALERVFSGDGDLLVVNYVASHTKDLTTEEIRQSLRRCRAIFDFPALTEVIEGEGPTRKRRRTGRVSHKEGEVTLAMLIQAGLLQAPLALEKKYKGQLLKARLEKGGHVRFGKERYASPSMAAGMARASVIGLRENGTPPPTNGWTFWTYRTAEKLRKTLDDARQRYEKPGAQAAG